MGIKELGLASEVVAVSMGHREHVLGVTHKPASEDTDLEIPEAELAFPGARERKPVVQ